MGFVGNWLEAFALLPMGILYVKLLVSPMTCRYRDAEGHTRSENLWAMNYV